MYREQITSKEAMIQLAMISASKVAGDDDFVETPAADLEPECVDQGMYVAKSGRASRRLTDKYARQRKLFRA